MVATCLKQNGLFKHLESKDVLNYGLKYAFGVELKEPEEKADGKMEGRQKAGRKKKRLSSDKPATHMTLLFC